MAERWLVSLADRTHGFQQRLTDLLSGGLESQLASVLLESPTAAQLSVSGCDPF